MIKNVKQVFHTITKGSISGASIGAVIGSTVGIILGSIALVIPGTSFFMNGPISHVLGLQGIISTTMTTTFTGMIAGAMGGTVMKL